MFVNTGENIRDIVDEMCEKYHDDALKWSLCLKRLNNCKYVIVKSEDLFKMSILKGYQPREKIKEVKDVVNIKNDENVAQGECEQTIIPSMSKIESQNAVNHPSHYNSGKYEVIDILQGMMSPEEFRGFCKGNVLKYILRADHKHDTPTEDFKKAHWYLNKLINTLENNNE